MGNSDTLIVISSVESAQVPLWIVQRNVVDVPGSNPVMADVSELADTIVAVPLTTVHVPTPIPAEFAVMLVLVVLHRF